MEDPKNDAAVCRLCDKISGNMLNIFQKNKHGMQIVNLIKDTLPIIVYRTDPLSKLICDTCEDTLTTIHNFKKTALEVLNKHSQDLSLKSENNTKVQLFLDNLKNQQLNEEWQEKHCTKPKSPMIDKSVSTDGMTNGVKENPRIKPVMNGIADDAAESDMEICEPGEISESKIIITKRKRRISDTNGPLTKRKRMIGPKSKMKPNPRIKITTKTVYNPFSLLKCVLHAINKNNLDDFDEKPYEEKVVEKEEIISICTYCNVIFKDDCELAVHEMNAHIKLMLDKVDAFELWDNNEKFASIRNRWLKKTLEIEESTEDGEEEDDDDDDDDDYEGEEEDEDEEEEEEDEEEEENLLVPLEEDTGEVNTTRNANIVFINEHPSLNGVLLRDIPKDKRQDFYQSVTLNGVKRKFCNLCRYTYKDNWAVELHYMSRTCYYSCNYCGIKFNKNKHEFSQHIKLHIASGDKKSDKVFVNRSKSSSIPRLVGADNLKPYTPGPSRLRNKVKPINMKSLLEKKQVNPTTLRIKAERPEPELTPPPPPKVMPKLEPVTRRMTTVDLAKTSSQAYFCKKCYQVFPKLNEYNEHNQMCTGEIDDPEMHLIRPYNKKDTVRRSYTSQLTPKLEPTPPKQETKVFSPTGRPVRHCVREVVSYNDDREPDFIKSRASPATSTPGRFECSFCASVFPTVHSRNSHMRIHKSGFKHAPGKIPAAVAPKDYNKYKRVIKMEPMEMPLNKQIKQETFEPIVEIHEGPSSKVPSNIGSVSITPLGRNAQKQVSPAIMQLVQNNPNITIKTKTQAASPRPMMHNTPSPVQENDGRTYKCSSCSKPFANKSNLYFHKKNQCGGSKYPCPFCKKRFGTEASYSSHIFYSHPV